MRLRAILKEYPEEVGYPVDILAFVDRGGDIRAVVAFVDGRLGQAALKELTLLPEPIQTLAPGMTTQTNLVRGRKP